MLIPVGPAHGTQKLVQVDISGDGKKVNAIILMDVKFGDKPEEVKTESEQTKSNISLSLSLSLSFSYILIIQWAL